MDFKSILKVASTVGKGTVTVASVAAPFAGGGLLGALLSSIVYASHAIDQANAGAKMKEVAMAQLAISHPDVDKAKLSQAADLQVQVMKLLEAAQAKH